MPTSEAGYREIQPNVKDNQMLPVSLLKNHKIQLMAAALGGMLATIIFLPRPNPEIRTVVRVEEKIVEKKGEVRERVVWKTKDGTTIEKEVVKTIEVKTAEKKQDTVSISQFLPRYEAGIFTSGTELRDISGYAAIRLGNLPLKAASTFGIGVFTIGVVYEW